MTDTAKDAPLTDPRVDDLLKVCSELAQRVQGLESIAHSEHTLSAEGVEQIATIVMGKVRQFLGHSGEPSRG